MRSSRTRYSGKHRPQRGAGRLIAAAAALAVLSGVAAVMGRSSAGAADAPSLTTPASIAPAAAAQAHGQDAWQVPPPVSGAATTATQPGSPAAVCTAKAMTPPSHLFIPSLCVDAPLDQVGVGPEGMDVPADPARVGYLSTAAALDAQGGTTVLAGHVNYGSVQGALWHLTGLKPGALIVTTDASGAATRWRVYQLEQVHKQPIQGPRTGPRELLLVSCAGKVVGHHYEDNVIAHAVPESKTVER
jgi:hypothetical protein